MPLSDRCNRQIKLHTNHCIEQNMQFVPSLLEINYAVRGKMALSAKCVKIADFFRKSDTGLDQWSDLDQALENVEPEGKTDPKRRVFKE